MKSYLNVYYNGRIHVFGILNGSDVCRIELKNEFVIDVVKYHNHCYGFKAFFYRSKEIYSYREYKTKSKLNFEIQKLLQEKLYNVVQN